MQLYGLERRPKVIIEIGGYLAGDTHTLFVILSLARDRSDSIPFTRSLSLSISDACRCRSTWWGEIVNDASHGKSGSPGHATPSPVSSSSMGLYL